MKKIAYIIAFLFLILIIGIVALPVWLPWLLKPVGGKFGLEYSEYERIGYARFALNEVGFEHEVVSFSAERIEGFLPLAWARRVLTGSGDERDYLSLATWRVEVTPPEKVEIEEPEDVFAYEIFELVEGILGHVIRWVPRVSVGYGTVAIDPVEIVVDGMTWERGMIEARAGMELGKEFFELGLAGDLRDPLAISIDMEIFPYSVSLNLSASRSEEALTVDGGGSWEGNAVTYSARFGREDVLPSEALLGSDAIRIPSELLGVPQYEALSGDFRAIWEDEGYRIDARAAAEPVSADSPYDPVDVVLRIDGDLESARVASASLRTPWVHADLSEPLSLDYRGRVFGEPSALLAAVDLSEQKFFQASGILEARIGIAPGPRDMPEFVFNVEGREFDAFEVTGESLGANGRVYWTEETFDDVEDGFPLPHATFEITASGIAAFGRVLDSLVADGDFVPPVATLGTLEALLADGTSLNGFIDFDVIENRIGRGEAVLDLQEEVVRDFLPEGIGFERARLSARVSGPVDSVAHEVEFAMDSLRTPEVKPGDLRLSWKGDFLEFEEWRLSWSNEDEASIEAVGRFSGALDRAVLDLETLVFSRGDETFLELISPMLLEVSEREGEDEPEIPLQGWRVMLDRLALEGIDQRIVVEGVVDWPNEGRLAADISGFNPSFLAHFLTVGIPDMEVGHLAFESSWDETGPLSFKLDNATTIEVIEGERLNAVVAIEGDGDGIRIEAIEIGDEESMILTANGTVPVVFYPGRVRQPVEIDFERDLRFAAASDPEAVLWTRLSDIAGIHLETPELTADISGTLANPTGNIEFRTQRVEYTRDADVLMPRVEEVELRTVFDIAEARVEVLRFLLEGQEVRVHAALPLGEDAWVALLEDREIPEWRGVEANLVIDQAQLEPFVQFAPELLSPQGTLSVDLAVVGDRFERGEIVLRGAATRPLMPIGSLQDIRARILFEDRTAILEEFSGRLGGERMTVTGQVTVPDSLEPDFEIAIRGDNLPLTRQPGLVIRGDVDLRIQGSGEVTPSVTGDINMRESLVITELRAMAPVAVATPERRPPFFSVEQEPLASWILDVNIQGDQFLSVRAPGFRGRLSAYFNLRGTLLEPQAIGEVTIDGGAIRFPFATLRIDQGSVSMTQDNPYRPQLFVLASSRIFGYDIQMELRGTADDPVLEFSSHPPLSSEAILLMITAGELPRGELTFTGQQKATKLALYIAQNLFLEFGGDDDATEKLTIRSGENISEQGRETFYVEYMHWPRVGVVGEYDRFDAFNAGIKWKFFSR